MEIRKDILDVPLGNRMKLYEKEFEIQVPHDKHIIVRIDGHKFSKYTQGFAKPFDEILSKSMELTTRDLLHEFNAVTGYTQSDEITLVIPYSFTEKPFGDKVRITNQQIFGGRVQKMASLVSGFTTMRFNKHLRDFTRHFTDGFMYLTDEESYYIRMLSEKLETGAYFDARVYGVDSDEEAFNSVMWRVRDCVKNSYSMFAQSYVPHKALLNKNGPEQIAFCLSETGKDWHDIEDRYKYGILVKKETYLKAASRPSDLPTGAEVLSMPVQRTRIKSWSEKLTTFSDEKVDMVISKTVQSIEQIADSMISLEVGEEK